MDRFGVQATSVASDLMDFIFKWAGASNFRRIIAGVTKGNARALKFYTKYGFSVVEEASPNESGGVYLVKEVKREYLLEYHPQVAMQTVRRQPLPYGVSLCCVN